MARKEVYGETRECIVECITLRLESSYGGLQQNRAHEQTRLLYLFYDKESLNFLISKACVHGVLYTIFSLCVNDFFSFQRPFCEFITIITTSH